LVKDSKSHQKSSAQLCHQELVEQLRYGRICGAGRIYTKVKMRGGSVISK